jgi:AcrR family transcriptional regulator
MPTREAATNRGRERRQQLLRATADLVAERGYHAVGVTEIGAAAGVTGAAIYRHFGTKMDLLVALMDQVVDGLQERAAVATRAKRPLDSLISAHVEFALRNRAIIAVYDQEAHNLPPNDLRRLRRKQRAYVNQWATVLSEILPSQSAQEALARVQATFGLLNSVSDFPSPLPKDEMALMLNRMAKAALVA